MPVVSPQTHLFAKSHPYTQHGMVSEMQTSQLQAMQEMQRESLKVTVETLHHLAGVKAGQKAPRVQSGERKAVGTGVSAKRSGSAFEEPIKALWLKNQHITAVEAGKKVGCSHVTAAAILKTLRGVKVTPDAFREAEGVEDGERMLTFLVVHPVRIVVPVRSRKAKRFQRR